MHLTVPRFGGAALGRLAGSCQSWQRHARAGAGAREGAGGEIQRSWQLALSTRGEFAPGVGLGGLEVGSGFVAIRSSGTKGKRRHAE